MAKKKKVVDSTEHDEQEDAWIATAVKFTKVKNAATKVAAPVPDDRFSKAKGQLSEYLSEMIRYCYNRAGQRIEGSDEVVSDDPRSS